MNTNVPCKKTLIAHHHGLQVYFCETHQSAELVLAGLSLRVELEHLYQINELLNMACHQLLRADSESTYLSLMTRLKKLN